METKPLLALFTTFQTKFINYTHAGPQVHKPFSTVMLPVLCGFITVRAEYVVIGTECSHILNTKVEQYGAGLFTCKASQAILIDWQANFPDSIYVCAYTWPPAL